MPAVLTGDGAPPLGEGVSAMSVPVTTGAVSAPDPARAPVDVERVRAAFDFPVTGRVVTNNAATTQPPRKLLDLYSRLILDYENVHRGQSTASRRTTERFEASYDTIAACLNARV